MEPLIHMTGNDRDRTHDRWFLKRKASNRYAKEASFVKSASDLTGYCKHGIVSGKTVLSEGPST